MIITLNFLQRQSLSDYERIKEREKELERIHRRSRWPNKIFLDTKRPICGKILNIGSWWQAQEVKKEVLNGGARVFFCFLFFLLLLSEALSLSWSLLLFIFILQEATRWTSITGWPPTANHHPPHANHLLFIQGNRKNPKAHFSKVIVPIFHGNHSPRYKSPSPQDQNSNRGHGLRKRVQSPSRLVSAAQNAIRSNIFIWMPTGFSFWQ